MLCTYRELAAEQAALELFCFWPFRQMACWSTLGRDSRAPISFRECRRACVQSTKIVFVWNSDRRSTCIQANVPGILWMFSMAKTWSIWWMTIAVSSSDTFIAIRATQIWNSSVKNKLPSTPKSVFEISDELLNASDRRADKSSTYGSDRATIGELSCWTRPSRSMNSIQSLMMTFAIDFRFFSADVRICDIVWQIIERTCNGQLTAFYVCKGYSELQYWQPWKDFVDQLQKCVSFFFISCNIRTPTFQQIKLNKNEFIV